MTDQRTPTPMTTVSYSEWVGQAACRDADPELFFPRDESNSARAVAEATEEAKTYCRRCPVASACLESQMRYEEENGSLRSGVFGGLDDLEREALAVSRSARPERRTVDVARIAEVIDTDPWATFNDVAKQIGFTRQAVQACLRRAGRHDLIDLIVANGQFKLLAAKQGALV